MKISNSRSTIWLLALASFCTSAAAGQSTTEPVAAPERAAELELALAREPVLYLVLRLAERRLEIKARGLVLDSVALTDAELVRYTPPGAPPAPADELPTVRTVVASDRHALRKVVTATALVPYPRGGAEEKPAAPAAASGSTHSPLGDEPDPEPPASYRIGLDAAWELRVGQGAVRPSLAERLRRTLGDSWRHWRGDTAAGGVVLGLAMTAEDARRVHHLFDQGSTLLVR